MRASLLWTKVGITYVCQGKKEHNLLHIFQPLSDLLHFS